MVEQEEIMWKQRSRALWLKEGDQNTRFSHSKASHRHKKNTIYGIKNEEGVWREGSDVVTMILKYLMTYS